MTDVNVAEPESYISEDEDAKTPTTESKPPAAGERRRQLVRQGIDSGILAVLDCKFHRGNKTYTFLDASGPEFLDAKTGQPAYDVLTAFMTAMDLHYHLKVEKTRLFEILGWKFECRECREIKFPAEYENTIFVFYDAVRRPSWLMTSGPCVACKERASQSKPAHVPYKASYRDPPSTYKGNYRARWT